MAPLLAAAIIPMSASAIGLSVPVTAAGTAASGEDTAGQVSDSNDILRTLQDNFASYTVGNEDMSLRALLTGNPSSAMAVGLVLPGVKDNEIPDENDTVKAITNPDKTCILRPIADTRKGKARTGGSWDYINKNGGFLPQGSDPQTMSPDDYAAQAKTSGDFSGVQVNASAGLSCLLQQMVEQNKLALNLQIHNLLREQIAAAQAKAVANRLQGMNAAAVTRQSEGANSLPIRDADGNTIGYEAFPSWATPEDYACILIKRRANEMVDTVMRTDDPYRFDTARRIYVEQNKQCDDLTQFQQGAQGTLVNKDDPDAGAFASQQDVTAYYNGDSSKAKHDPLTTLSEAARSNNNPQGSGDSAVSQFQKMASNIRSYVEVQYQANGGFLSKPECPPESKNCDVSQLKNVTPGAMQREQVLNVSNNYQKQLENANSQEDLAALSTDQSTADVITEGYTNFNPDNYEKSPQMYDYIREFYNGIRNGYFDLQGGTTDWASGAMLSIYDAVVTDPHTYREASEANLDNADQIPEPVVQ